MSTATKIARSFTFSDSQAGALVRAAGSVRSVNPAGAALIFAVAYLAGVAGSFAVLLVAAALFAGLYAARVSASTASESPAPIRPYDWSKLESESHGMPDDFVSCFGLPVKTITFAAAPAKPAGKRTGKQGAAGNAADNGDQYNAGMADGYYGSQAQSTAADYVAGYAAGKDMNTREYRPAF